MKRNLGVSENPKALPHELDVTWVNDNSKILSCLPQQVHNLAQTSAIKLDAAQLALVAQLEDLRQKLVKKKTNRPLLLPFKWFYRPRCEQIKGLYIYGQVGRGKTMIMDLFYECLETPDKRRIHFNDFMAEVQIRLDEQRQKSVSGKTKNSDPIIPVAAALAARARVLCFDEFCVTDIADAMILGRLFAKLFEFGVVLVATSNVAPDDLYQDGLNRALFLPFIPILKNHVDVFNLDGATDYRMEKVTGDQLYFYPRDPIIGLGEVEINPEEEMNNRIDAAWNKICASAAVKTNIIAHRGREIKIRRECGDAVRFDFSELSLQALSAYDYAVLVKHYRTFFIDNVPVFNNDRRNEAKRFILLIDTLYEARARVFISAAAPPDKLYQTDFATTESFEFARTASRLYEMQSADYLAHFS